MERTGLTTTALSRLLRPYGIKPGHNTAKTTRGYDKEWFVDAFTRYLPSEPVRSSKQAADQSKHSDGLTAPDGSTRPEALPDARTDSDGYTARTLEAPNGRTGQPVRATPTRPGEPARHKGFTDARTGLDATAPETDPCPACGWPYDSNAHAANCNGRQRDPAVDARAYDATGGTDRRQQISDRVHSADAPVAATRAVCEATIVPRS